MKRIRAIALCVFLCALLLLFTACAPKTPQTPEGFTALMEKAGFSVQDATDEFGDEAIVETLLIASNEQYQIEFYQTPDAPTGDAFFQNAKEYYEEKYSSKTLSAEINGINHNYHAFIAENRFHLIACIDHTVIRSEADPQYRGEIVNLVKALGYR